LLCNTFRERLGTDWYSPGQGDLPLPVPCSRVLPGKRNQRPTALEALALKVPSEGPKVDVVALAPWEVPNWVEHVSYMGVTVSPSPQSKDEENEKLHKLREYARDFRRQHTTDAEQFDWDSDDGDYGLAIGRLVVT
jgi:hypothetical protein